DDATDGSGTSNGQTSNNTSNGQTSNSTNNSTTFVEGDTDLVDYSCNDPNWTAGEASTTMVDEPECTSAQHVPEPVEIPYTDTPPACGPHRPQWGVWGEYTFLPPQRFLHNLEHGGIALLYHPCADTTLVDALRAYAQARQADDGGDFRWVLTPYPELPTAFAALAWGHRYMANTFDEGAVEAFVTDHYRNAPEDVRSDGGYDRLWLGR
ncbi:MAG: DUF3105 domain-containing protein, partial [Myxococcota bacterium]